MKSIKILRYIFVSLVIVISMPAWAASYTLGPTDDAFVYAAQPDTNYGTLSGLATGWNWPGTSDTWVTYLKFYLNAIPGNESITDATLNLYQFLGGGYAQIGTNLYRIANDIWSESTVTWNTQPSIVTLYGAVGGDLLGSNANGWAYQGWSSWNLFQAGAWNAAVDRQDGYLTLLLFETAGGTQSHNFCSRETDPTYCPASAGHQPYLAVTTTAAVVPLPPSLWLFVSALVGMLALARRRSDAQGRLFGACNVRRFRQGWADVSRS